MKALNNEEKLMNSHLLIVDNSSFARASGRANFCLVISYRMCISGTSSFLNLPETLWLSTHRVAHNLRILAAVLMLGAFECGTQLAALEEQYGLMNQKRVSARQSANIISDEAV